MVRQRPSLPPGERVSIFTDLTQGWLFDILYTMKIADVSPDQVMSVYSGKANYCCCGCAGNHRYNSKHVRAASKWRGYPVRPEEISDRSVAIVLNKIKRYADCIDMVPEGSANFFSAVAGDRLYIAYLLPNKKKI